ncbi:MAG TPA: hypothetical protein VHE60_12830 [Pyrinomonadaceae bacterium]|nr:hypothetical protein [Pyrinomonadaceae bacterium]
MEFINRLSQRASLRLGLVLPVMVYVAIAIFWQSRGFYEITGDEPHYLLITDSLVRDHDLQVENNYLIDTPVRQASASDLSGGAHTYNRFSRHNIGLPLLLTIPYSIAGITGVRVFMALLAGLWPLLLFKVLVQFTLSRVWSLVTALVVAIGLPFSAASNQIYPDLLAGMITLYVTWRVFGGFRNEGPSFSLVTSLSIGLSIAFLPWLHLRFAPPAIVLLAAYTYVVMRRSGIAASHPLRRRYVIPAGFVLSSLILLGLYNRAAFGSIFGPFSESYLTFRPTEIGMIFFGLHWDQSEGMFVQQPMLLLGLIGIPALLREHRQGAIILGLLYCSVLVPAAMHPALYGGYSFLGRFWWTVVSLWIFPMAFAVRSLLKRNALTFSFLCLGAIALQGWLAAKWLLHDHFLMNLNVPVWAARSFFDDTDLLRYLPTFRDFDAYLKHPANYVAVLADILLIVSGLLWRRRKHLVAGLWSVFLITGAAGILLIPPSTGSLKLKGIDLPSQIGTLEGFDRVATEKDGPGWLTFGPYTMLVKGRYEAALEYESTAVKAGFARFDISCDQGGNVIKEAELPPSNANHGVFTFEFLVSREQSLNSLFEFRIRYLGHGEMKMKRLTITPVSITGMYDKGQS